jgi:FMN-dependent NADH-azoreductase
MPERKPMKVLHIDSSITGEASLSRQLSAAVVDALRARAPGLELIRRDLDAQPLPHLDGQALAGGDATVVQEFLDADVVVIGAPMYNFTVSSQLKAWIDRVLIAGKTFRYTAEGPEGLAGGRTVIIASSRGGLYGPETPTAAADFQEPYLRWVFGFMGISDVRFVRAEGVAYGPEQRQAALDAALAATNGIAQDVALARAA